MMEASAKTKFVAGLFMLAVIVAFSGMMLFMQSWSPDVTGKSYWVSLSSAPDLSVQSPVVVGAQKVGQISRIEIRTVEETTDGVAISTTRRVPRVFIQVFVEDSDERKFEVYANATARVVTKFFGSAMLELDPGFPQAPSETPIAAESVIQGTSPPTMSDLMAKGVETMESLQPALAQLEPMMIKVSRTIDSLQSIAQSMESALQPIGTQEFGERLATITRNVESLTTNLGGMTEDLKPVVTRINSTITTLGDLVDSESENIRAIVGNAKEMSESLATLTRNANDEVLPKVNDILEELRAMTNKGSTFIDENSADLKRTIENVAAITDEFRASFAGRLEGILNRADQTLANIARMSAQAEGMMTENRSTIRRVLTSLRETMDGVKATITKLQRDPSILVWGTDDADNAADRDPAKSKSIAEEKALRDSGRLPPRERD